MYEFTHKGAWFSWSSLDAADKRLVTLSLLAAIPPGFVVGLASGAYGYRAGYWLASGGKAAPPSHFEEMTGLFTAVPVMLAALACAVISALVWWRFSLRQDEMFNRVQNYALGCASAWTIAAASAWWFLQRAGQAPPLPVEAWLLLAYALVCLFWFRAVRRWA